MPRKIVVTSGKGGVGKTTVVANLGARLGAMGYRVVLIDADLGLNNLDVVMGVENKVTYDVIDVIEGRCSLRRAVIGIEGNENLFIMPSAHAYSKAYATSQNLRVVVDRLAEIYDYVIIDCPAGIEAGFHRAIGSAKEAIVVTTPDISSIRDACKIKKALEEYKIQITGLVVNMARGDLISSGDMMSVGEITSIMGVCPIGILPQDDVVGMCSYVGSPIIAGSDIFTAFEMLADNVNYNECNLFDCTKKYKGIFGRLRRDVKRKI